MVSTETYAKRKVRSRILAAVVIVTTIIVVLGFALFASLSGVSSKAFGNDVAGAAPTPQPTAEQQEACDPAYKQIAVDRGNNRVDNGFATKYAEATAGADNLSEAQINLLLDQTGKDAWSLAIWAHALGLPVDANAWQPLVDGECLSSEGIKLHNQFEGVLIAEGTTVTEAEAPADGFNSGISDGVFGVDPSQGVSGDRKAIKITLKDGSVAYIMVRCGNVVYPGKPSLPTVPTDNPPPPANPECPPGTNGTWPVCKDNASHDPGPSGNAPIGQGPNEDPGPGPFVPPGEMEQPPEAPRVDPAPPAPTPPAPSGPSSPVPTPDPAPAPTPEPSAPPPAEAPDDCPIPPGMDHC